MNGIRHLLTASLCAFWLAGCDETGRALRLATAEANASSASSQLVDGGRGRIWTLSREGLIARQLASGESYIVPLPGWIVAGPLDASRPVLALAPGGDILVTSNVIPAIWRVDARSLAVSVHWPSLDPDDLRDFGFVRLAYSPSEGQFIATSAPVNALWRIDRGLTRAKRIVDR